MEVNTEELQNAFIEIQKAIHAALCSKFPVGMEAIEYHMELKRNLFILSEGLKAAYDVKTEEPVEEAPKVDE